MKTSVKALATDALRADTRARLALQRAPLALPKGSAKNIKGGEPLVGAVTLDSFINLAHKLGVGADNSLTTATYGFNPITRQRQLLEWMYRGSWLAGVAIDAVADDMTRAGIDFVSQINPEEAGAMEAEATRLGVWDALGNCIRWGRLYGGALAVHMIDGQDFKTPLRIESIAEDQYKGITVLDRWMVEPVLNDLVTEMGPDLGLPKYYKVLANAPALRNQTIHYSRVALRHVGIGLPYQQALTENLWGESILERIHDRMIAYDGASMGAAQLVQKAFLRTLSVDGLRDIVAQGGASLAGLVAYADNIRRFQNLEGLTLIDKEDTLEYQQTSAFSGLSDALLQFAQQLSGALQIPLTRLLGQSPKGLGNEGESDMKNYYDGISQQQNRLMHVGVTTIYRCLAASQAVTLDDDFALAFTSLWQMTPVEKATVAKESSDAVGGQFTNGLIGRQTALKELRQIGKATGVFTNITDEAIDSADDEVLPPLAETELGLEHEKDLTETQLKHQSTEADKTRKHAAAEADKGRKHAEKLTKEKSKQQRKPLT